jgi:hypothetical protein
MAGFATVTKTAQNIADAVKRQFGDESGVQITDTDIFRWINQGQLDICRRQRLLKGIKLANVVAGTSDYTIPDDVLFVQEIVINGQSVAYRSYEEASAYILENDPLKSSTGMPDIWYEWAGIYTFWPVPDLSVAGINNLKLLYVKAPTDVTALANPLSIPDTYYNLLLEYVTAQAHEMDEDWTAAQIKGQQYETGIMRDSEDGDRVYQGTYQRITVLPEDM